MTVVITGAAGVLGRALALQARRRGDRVVGIVREPGSSRPSTTDATVVADLASNAPRDWLRICGNAAVVFHLAADTQVYAPNAATADLHAAMAQNACAMARQLEARIVFFSSSAVYSGPATQRPLARLTESDATIPNTEYGRGKRAAEQIISDSGIPAVTLRIFGVLSEQLMPAAPRGNLLQSIGRCCRTGETLKLGTDGDGQPAIRDYVNEEDLCRVALEAAELPLSAAASHVIVNVCTGVPTTTLELVQCAQAATGRLFPIELVPRTTLENPVMVGDPARLSAQFRASPVSRVNEFWENYALRRV